MGYPETGVDRVPVDVTDDLLWFSIAFHPLPVPPTHANSDSCGCLNHGGFSHAQTLRGLENDGNITCLSKMHSRKSPLLGGVFRAEPLMMTPQACTTAPTVQHES